MGGLWERKERGFAPPLPSSSPASLPESGWWRRAGGVPLASLILASHLADPSSRPGVLSAGLGGKSLDWGGAGRKQWHDFPGQWGPCEEGWRGEEGEFSRPTSHRTDQPARPGPDLPQFSPKVSPRPIGNLDQAPRKEK